MYHRVTRFLRNHPIHRLPIQKDFKILQSVRHNQSNTAAIVRCHHITHVLLIFAERNPGMCRILTGDALMGENERLRIRVHQFFEKLESQYKQVLRERKLREGKGFTINEQALANILVSFSEGKISQYVHSCFTKKPSEDFSEQWLFLLADK